MRPSGRGFKNTVVFKTWVNVPDSSGDTGSKVYSSGTPDVRCSVQQHTMTRVVVHGTTESVCTHTIYFRSLPLDVSTGARPAPNNFPQLEDLFNWTGRKLYALGEDRDAAGRGVLNAIMCEERK